jgi:DNA repair photolyase
MDAVARLNEAGIPCGVFIAPVLPGITDDPAMLEDVVRAAVAAGAVGITSILLHLRPGVRSHYMGWLAEHHPELVADHRRRYPRSYAPEDARRDHDALIRRLVRRHGGVAAAPRALRGRVRAAAPPDPHRGQLTLLG